MGRFASPATSPLLACASTGYCCDTWKNVQENPAADEYEAENPFAEDEHGVTMANGIPTCEAGCHIGSCFDVKDKDDAPLPLDTRKATAAWARGAPAEGGSGGWDAGDAGGVGERSRRLRARATPWVCHPVGVPPRGCAHGA